ncbi:MAG: hypothetical protein U1C74_19705 [Phenylobacterium sp.]|uniref:hypothetical protein n=1 Tax=Alphaproteobacteria TaxID=28211 RepID=UPI0002E49112|nr:MULTISPECIES: hypothetical protein [unclassified Brevundimonas]MBA4331812.1 hypothetical protein [Brevundimonas sp.]MBU2419148.1 hypothetical protein [Alphaproteobacteria bacterium]MDZ4318656.1 hypothetical protein [Phenylobacterium sp.]MDZ4373630.1 hypothetical protein [Phenylobacterium sp.]
MHTVTFYPIGNADSCLIELENNRNIVFDFADVAAKNDENEKRIDLEKALRDALDTAGRDDVDTLALSHLDRDHINRVSEVFEFDHADKYQGGDRIKVTTLWAPAAALLEKNPSEEGRIIRQELRHRLKNDYGVQIFSRPRALDDWMRGEGIDPDTRRHRITDAGQLAPGFSLADDGVEFFVHSPFAERCDDGGLIERNEAGLFMQATFDVGGRTTRLILAADCGYEVIEGIIRQTRRRKNHDRLLWDINNIPHHCSYKSLAAEKGTTKTDPAEPTRWLYETQGQPGGALVSTSCPIPTDDTDQPPHRQAAAYYRDVAKLKSGPFLVSMEEPSTAKPEPLVFKIDGLGVTRKRAILTSTGAAVGDAAPRAGIR